MHTLAGEVKACFAMLSGDAYTASNKTAQAIKTLRGRSIIGTCQHRFVFACKPA